MNSLPKIEGLPPFQGGAAGMFGYELDHYLETLLLKLTEGMVETRSIKGTRSRHSDVQIDKQQAEELQQSEKDRAENIMIVGLMRNDLSRVCTTRINRNGLN